MPEPMVGEIRMFGGSFAPNGWAFCNGQLLPISENETLFNLIGTTYGGDGQETFALPNLQSRVPMHAGTSAGPGGITYQLGEQGGVEEVTLTTQQIPNHTHPFTASTGVAQSPDPTARVVAQTIAGFLYIEEIADAQFNANAATPVGGSQPHTNLQPYLAFSFIISLFGIYPRPS